MELTKRGCGRRPDVLAACARVCEGLGVKVCEVGMEGLEEGLDVEGASIIAKNSMDLSRYEIDWTVEKMVLG